MRFDSAPALALSGARLQDRARGEGIVASYDMCAEHFDQLARAGSGTAGHRFVLRDIGPVSVYASTGVDLPLLPPA